MNIWNILKIEATKDKSKINRAYIQMLKTIDQDLQVKLFEQVREAYDCALDYASCEYSYDVETINGNKGEAIEGPFVNEPEPFVDDSMEIEGPFSQSGPSSQTPQTATVTQDIQKLAISLYGDEKEAISLLRDLLTQERYALAENRSPFEIEVLYLLHKLEPFPYFFASEVELLFEWNIYSNPYPKDYQLGYIFKSVLRKIAQQRKIQYIIIHYIKQKNSKHPAWKDIEKIIFGPFDESRLTDIAEGNHDRDGVGFILDYILSQKYHPDESPVLEQTLSWWKKAKQHANTPQYKPPVSKRKKVNYTFWGLILIAFAGGGFVFNMNNYSYSYMTSKNEDDVKDYLPLPSIETASIDPVVMDVVPDAAAVDSTQEERVTDAAPSDPVVDVPQAALQVESAQDVSNKEMASINSSMNSPSENLSMSVVPEVAEKQAPLLRNSAETQTSSNAGELDAPFYLDNALDEAYANRDYQQVFVLATAQTQLDNPHALKMLGDLYGNGYGLRANQSKAAKYYRQAAKLGDVESQIKIAQRYRKGKGIRKSKTKSNYWYKKAAAQNQPLAQNEVGLMYKKGRSVKRNYKQAVTYFTRAAEQGDASAQNNLGLMYKNGLGVKRDHVSALAWFNKAAEQNNINAYINMGAIYRDGGHKVRNISKAITWYKKAAKNNKVYAMEQLGVLYSQTKGRHQNFNKAFKWYQVAARKGSSRGQNNLAMLYSNGKGVAKNYNKAVYWFNKSANQGNADAQLKLGQLYEYGGRDIKNISMAIRWYRTAANNGSYAAKINLQRIKQRRSAVWQEGDYAFEDDESEVRITIRPKPGFRAEVEYAFEDDDDEKE